MIVDIACYVAGVITAPVFAFLFRKRLAAMIARQMMSSFVKGVSAKTPNESA